MKILKYGEGYPKIAICEHCGSELEYDNNDIITLDTERKNVVKNTIVRYRCRHINCPACQHWINVGETLLYERQEFPK